MATTFRISQEGPANALALNKYNTQVVVAGRNVFRVLSIEENEFVELCNLRVGKNINLNFLNHVAWSTLDDAQLATAATNGAVQLWNLNKSSKSKQEHVFNDHKRTVNKVSFHPTDAILLTGSQDGTMKCFDLRINDVTKTFVSNSESVRDLQFNPHNPYFFSSVSENGNVQIWDLRRTERYTQQFAAHSGPIFACDWHPELQLLATASRDKTIKVWDMNLKPTLEFTIHTLAPIGHIKWRPQRRFHIASCALVVDTSVNIWDVRRPYIPFAAFDGHKDVATGVAWRGSPHVFLSTSRDCTVVQHVFSHAKRPLDAANPQGISFSGCGDILLATRRVPPAQTPEAEKFLHASSSLQVFMRTEYNDVDAFVHCAKKYLLAGRSLAEMCEVNAAVARAVGRSHVGLVWDVVRTLFNYSHSFEERGLSIRNEELLLPDVKGVSKVVSSCDASEADKSLRGLDASILEEDVEVEEFDFSVQRPSEIQAQGDFFFGDGEPDPLSVDQLEAAPRFQPDWTLKAEAFITRHEILEGAPPEPYSVALEPQTTAEPTAPAVTIHSVPLMPPLRFGELIIKALRHHVDAGDIQTAVAVLAVIGDRRRDIDLPPEVQEHWLLSYLDILSRHRLFIQAAELIKIAWLPSVSQLSQQSTTIYTTCGACSKPLTRCGWLCDRCKSTPCCALCHQVVRGLQVWCQGCGHGGHAAHIAGWFRTKKMCATGCGHACEY